MKAILIFWPKANSPLSMDGPSAKISSFLTISPALTIGFWLIHVFWFDLVYLIKLYTSEADLDFLSVTLTTILDASTLSTTPEFLATIQTPESLATTVSKPVPTNGFSALKTGTACLCIFEPINALLASSCSKNGISEAAIETTCWGETSINSILSGDINSNSLACLTATKSSINLLFASNITFAWAITYSDSSIADK